MPIFNNIEVGERLSIKRQELGFERSSHFAKEIGVDVSQYAKIEKGDLPLTDKIWELIEEKFQIDKVYLFFGINVPRDTLSSSLQEPGPDASLEDLMIAKREFERSAEAIGKRIDDLLFSKGGSGNSDNLENPSDRGNAPKKGRSRKGGSGKA